MSDETAVELPPPPPQDAGAAIVAAAELLWPAPATVSVSRRGTPPPAGSRIVREHLLAPQGTRPRLVVPAGARRAAAAVALRRSGSGGAAGRLAALGAAAFVRVGAADRVVRDRLRVTGPEHAMRDDIETRLGELLGTEVVVGLLDQGIAIAVIAGNHEILVTVIAPKTAKLDVPDTAELFSLDLDAKPGFRRAGLKVRIDRLVDILRELKARGADVEHFYDY